MGKQACDKCCKLLRERLIEPELIAQLLDRLRRRALSEDHACRVTRHDTQEKKDGDNHPGHHNEEPRDRAKQSIQAEASTLQVSANRTLPFGSTVKPATLLVVALRFAG